MKQLFTLLGILFLSMSIHAQQKTITGIVTTAEDGYPLPGVNVIIKGTTNGVQTDFDGKYTISVKPSNTLVFSYVGFENIEIKVGSQTNINVAMEFDAQLEEVVVVGYSTGGGRRNYSTPRPTLASKLSGRAYGLNAQNTRGYISQSTKTGNKATGSKDPLYVLNGKVVSEAKFKNVKADKVKHIEVLSAQQGKVLYDYQGSKGVVSIRTRGVKNNVDFGIINRFLDESYAPIQENVFKRPDLNPLSTFSIDVDKAAYSNIRRMINNGQSIPRDAVKIEEMINYFNYNYEQPKGDHPFSITTEVAQTPWHDQTKLVRIGLQGKTHNIDELPASNLTFLIDVSGSMDSPNKLGLLKSSFKLLVNQLREKDKVAIVVYAGAAGIVLKPTSGKHKQEIINALDQLTAGGSTAGGEGIKLAYKLAQKNFIKDGNNRVILATDGDFNVGASSDKDMQNLIEDKRKSGVFLSVLGFGYGNYKDSKLETLADKGNGNHAYIDTAQEAQKVFGKEFGGTLFTIAKDVKIQVEFNPKKVQAYRLIGYENRLLADEDFMDDTKDAGELGSGHTVTALYEIIPFGAENKYLRTTPELKYTKSNISEDYDDELFTVKFRYKKPDGSKSIEMVHVQNDSNDLASTDLKFASAVALLGMRLSQSSFANGATYKDIIELAREGRGKDIDGYRAEFIRLVESYENM